MLWHSYGHDWSLWGRCRYHCPLPPWALMPAALLLDRSPTGVRSAFLHSLAVVLVPQDSSMNYFPLSWCQASCKATICPLLLFAEGSSSLPPLLGLAPDRKSAQMLGIPTWQITSSPLSLALWVLPHLSLSCLHSLYLCSALPHSPPSSICFSHSLCNVSVHFCVLLISLKCFLHVCVILRI